MPVANSIFEILRVTIERLKSNVSKCQNKLQIKCTISNHNSKLNLNNMLVANNIFEILRVTIERLSSNLADSSGQFFMTQAGLIKQLQIEPITQRILYPRNLFLLPRAIQKQSSMYTTKTSCC